MASEGTRNGKAKDAARLLSSSSHAGTLPQEDELDAFPLPGETPALPPEPRQAVPGRMLYPALPAGAPPEQSGVVGAETADQAWARFRQDVDLTPTETTDAVAPVAESAGASAPGGGSTGGGGDDGGQGSGGDQGPAPQRRRRLEIVDRPMSIFEHLDELRRRLMWSIVAFVLGTVATFPFLKAILLYTERRFGVYGNGTLITLSPLEPMFAGLRIALIGGLVLGSPVILYQLFAFILPALTPSERRMVYGYLAPMVMLFVGGLAFGFYIFEPVVYRVGSTFLGTAVTVRSSVNNWVGFVVSYALPFGFVFELPVVSAVLTKLGIITPQALVAGRRWAILAAVVVGEAVSPPADFFLTPSMVAIPIMALYESGIIISRIAYR